MQNAQERNVKRTMRTTYVGLLKHKTTKKKYFRVEYYAGPENICAREFFANIPEGETKLNKNDFLRFGFIVINISNQQSETLIYTHFHLYFFIVSISIWTMFVGSQLPFWRWLIKWTKCSPRLFCVLSFSSLFHAFARSSFILSLKVKV